MSRLGPDSLPPAATAILVLTLVLSPGCSSSADDQNATPAAEELAAPPGATGSSDGRADEPEEPVYPTFSPAPDVHSLRLVRSIAVKQAPDGESDNLGTVARDTRVTPVHVAKGPGCESRWVEIEPRGWVCERHLEPSPRSPHGVELPKLARGALVPGRFGKVVGETKVTYSLPGPGEAEREPAVARRLEGAVTVREQGIRVHRGVRYWHVGGGEFVREDSIREHRAAGHVGVRLGDETGRTLPLAFAIHHKDPVHRVPAFDDAAESKRSDKILARTPVEIAETVLGDDGKPSHHRIAGDEPRWLRAADVRIAERSAPPPGTLPGERWVDIDLDTQILVAYEGELPIYATFVSTGRRAHATETGVYRVWIKFAETTMTGNMADEPSYSVATVPWTQFYANDLALHTAYWHDKFGIRKSHGCINLSPRDARFLYFWTDPDVPPGWSMAHGNPAYPGSMVRVRSSADPEPGFRGYAKTVYRARLSAKSANNDT